MKQYVAGTDMKYSWNIFKELPDVNFFRVGINGRSEVFMTLDNSVGFYSVQPFCPDHDMNFIDSIDMLWRGKDQDESSVCKALFTRGICFAETGIRYKFDNREELKRDYFIAKLANLSTRR